MRSSVAAYAAWVKRPDLPQPAPETVASYFICATPRSGSWLLCGLLASSGVAGRPHEWFLPEVEAANREPWGASGPDDYLALARRAGTTPNGVFGAKVMWGSMPPLLDRLRRLDGAAPERELIARRFPRPRYVWLRRDDVAAQAVSWSKAIRTGHWHGWDPPAPAGAPDFDRGQIDALERLVVAHNRLWSAWFAVNEIEPHAVRFEDLATDPVATTRGILHFLGLPNDMPVRPLTTGTHDAVNEDWLARRRGSG